MNVKPESTAGWLVAYTLPKTEKKAFQKLQLKGISTFLPLYEKLQVWSDRKKKVLFPLFPNYIFIKTELNKRFEALQLKELVRYISFGGKVVQLREEEIDKIRLAASGAKGEVKILNEDFQEKGLAVKVVKGPLEGLRGIVEHCRGKDRLLIRIESLRQVISLEVTADMLIKDDSVERIEPHSRFVFPSYYKRFV